MDEASGAVGLAEPFTPAELAALLAEPESISVSVQPDPGHVPPVLPEWVPESRVEDAAEQALMGLDAIRLRSCRDAAAQARLLAEFAAARARLDPWQDVSDGPLAVERSVQVGGRGTPKVEEFACAEVGAVLAISSVAARRRLADGLDLVHRHPDTLAALDAGHLDGYRAALLVRGTRRLDPDKARQVEAELLDRVGRLSIRKLIEQVKAAVIAADPALAEEQRTERRSFRGVHVTDSEDGTRELWALLDAAGATRLDARVDQVADWLALIHRHDHPGEPLPDDKDARRATALALLADPHEVIRLHERVQAIEARVSRAPTPRPVPATVLFVHAAAGSATAARWRSEEHGPMTPEEAAELVGHSSVTVKPVIDLPGLLDAEPEPRYRPSDRLAEAVDLAFDTDVFPYAGARARRCDADHDVAYPTGPTHLSNLSPKARFHHRVKTFGGWTVYRLGPQLHEWHGPTGRRYRVDPTGTRRLPASREGPAP